MDFGAPDIGKDTDVAQIGKNAQRVDANLHLQVIFVEPKQLDLATVLVGP